MVTRMSVLLSYPPNPISVTFYNDIFIPHSTSDASLFGIHRHCSRPSALIDTFSTACDSSLAFVDTVSSSSCVSCGSSSPDSPPGASDAEAPPPFNQVKYPFAHALRNPHTPQHLSKNGYSPSPDRLTGYSIPPTTSPPIHFLPLSPSFARPPVSPFSSGGRYTSSVYLSETGYGGLSLSIEGPSKADIECHDNQDGTCLVTYRPTEPGTYIINVKYADEHVPGSPFAVQIGGEPSARLMERITRRRELADVTHVGSQCELSLKIPGEREARRSFVTRPDPLGLCIDPLLLR
ncbi:unnamed protein product [Protopolystoma xenopodis]|uniref:Uncharacterized protein n=1 Tax=Protopolystoma xenopodis TaxID=117903 RepID=A0A3S5C6V7_9PLAT|nr:unnamed protein product [Protopolystoma xenopodis]